MVFPSLIKHPLHNFLNGTWVFIHGKSDCFVTPNPSPNSGGTSSKEHAQNGAPAAVEYFRVPLWFGGRRALYALLADFRNSTFRVTSYS